MLTVVIAARNRRDRLLATLHALAGQQTADAGWEIVVVDHGSTDGSAEAVWSLAAETAVDMRVLSEPQRGPAGARNAGVRAARGEVILFLGDDMVPEDPRFIAGHARLHALRPEESYAVLGRSTWHGERPMTPFMHWLERGGTRLAWDKPWPGPVSALIHFHTANLSLKKAALEAVVDGLEGGASETIVEAELGARLHEWGLVLDYHTELVAFHDQPAPLRESLSRMERIGRSGHVHTRLHRQVPHTATPEPRGAGWRAVEMLAPVWGILSRTRFPLSVREVAWAKLHQAAYAHGWRAG